MTTINNEAEQTEKKPNFPYAVAVVFRDAGKPYTFGSYSDNVHKGDHVVVETAQGMELGQVAADALLISRYNLMMPTKPIIRMATSEDLDAYARNLVAEEEAFKICKGFIEQLGLDMNLMSAKYTLDRTKILFVYLSSQRVDFRELLKLLGGKLHCRIELRQIGERDKAKMVGGIGMCGMVCCCRRFKNKFDVISINMAKNQLLALNIDKLSGVCGKLMCCLKYEDDQYKEMTQGLPKLNSQVEYEGQIYRLTSMNVMANEAKLENHEMTQIITLQDLKEKGIPRKGVVMQRRTDADAPTEHKVIRTAPVHVNTKVRQDAVHTDMLTFGTSEESSTHTVSTAAPAMKTAVAKRNERKAELQKKNNANNARKNQQRQPKKEVRKYKPEPGAKVTVRTFGKKKPEAEQ